MFSLGPWEIILIVLAIMLLFGARKLPELARGLGRCTVEFRKGLKDEEEEKSKDDEKPKDGEKPKESDVSGEPGE